ncbi:xanthine phosphoribosyltransferase [Ferrovibrio sp.]|uniref:xanthine phosphoribosyltransferase n=1 Tax=Ferrovibrio sp. TaxID=1917215 RepID=UPI0025C61161|nr:xanthine phosphoribosyltransferase [Ferrovibrio sp.]MBX3456358.1 xanthine phosphoribosyltransferase [Ferrovibrio sp.]
MTTETHGYTRFFPVSWEELHRHCKALAWRLHDSVQSKGGKYKGVVAVTRGGMVPAAIVARELKLRVIETISCSLYDELGRNDKVNVLKPATAALPDAGEGWLIIDDLVDTGITAKAVREILPKAHFATIYAKPSGRPMVDTYITEVSQDTWILFPWDQEAVMSKPIADLRGAD